MYKYFLLYYIKDFDDKLVGGLNSTSINLSYELNKSSIRRLENFLKKSLNVKRVTIVNYSKIN